MGFPSKSGVAGALMIVIPKVCGICTWSPRLDNLGNSVRGIAFCRELVSRFAFHAFDRVDPLAKEVKIDPCRSQAPSIEEDAILIGYAAHFNDAHLLRHLIARGFDVNSLDYDRRTAAHIAAVDGSLECLRLLIEAGAPRKEKLHPVAPPSPGSRVSIACAMRGGEAMVWGWGTGAPGADLTVKDRFGNTPLDDAHSQRQAAAAEMVAAAQAAADARGGEAAPGSHGHRLLRALRTQPQQTEVHDASACSDPATSPHSTIVLAFCVGAGCAACARWPWTTLSRC